MMLVGAAGQIAQHNLYDASGTIASNTLPQLILPRARSRSFLFVQNLSSANTMYIQIGFALATATLSTGTVASVAVVNGGFGYSAAPHIEFLGGGASNWPSYLGATEPTTPPPNHPAKAHCVMTGSAPNMVISSIVVDDPGSGYLIAPYVMIRAAQTDPNGALDPSLSSGNGIPLLPLGGDYYLNGTVCPTDPVSIFCNNGAGQRFTCKFMA